MVAGCIIFCAYRSVFDSLVTSPVREARIARQASAFAQCTYSRTTVAAATAAADYATLIRTYVQLLCSLIKMIDHEITRKKKTTRKKE